MRAVLIERGIRKQARAAARAGDWQAAASLYRRIAALGDPRVGDWIQLAHASKEAGDASSAVAAYRKAVATDPLSADAHRELSHFLRRLGDDDAALDALLRSWVADPTNRDAVELDQLRLDLGELDHHVQQALSAAGSPIRKPTRWLPAIRRRWQRRLGRRAVDNRNWVEAERRYRTILRLTPHDVDARGRLGQVLYEQGDVEAALAVYRAALLLRPSDADIHLEIGHALKRLGRLAGAFSAYLAAWRSNPGQGPAAEELMALNPALTRDMLRADAAGCSLPVDARRPTRLVTPAGLDAPSTLHFQALAGALGL